MSGVVDGLMPEALPQKMRVDYVLVCDASDADKAKRRLRSQFMQILGRSGLLAETERVGKDMFVKIWCPFERLAVEAEVVKLEKHLKGCEIVKKRSAGFVTAIFDKLKTEDETEFVSAPFYKDKLHVYEGHEDPDCFFRCSLRSLLVHHILINLDLNDLPEFRNRSSSQNTKNKLGLFHLLMHNVFKDAFILHDQSMDDPYFEKLRLRNPPQHARVMEKLKNYADPRRDLNLCWTKFYKYQPLTKIRNYFGEKIAFYFAWQGTLTTLLWFPSILGLCVFLYGVYLSINRNQMQRCECINNTAAFDAEPFSEAITTQRSFMECRSVLELVTGNIVEVIQEAFDNVLNPYFAVLTCVWGSIFNELWKRKHSRLSYEWDVQCYEDTEPDRPDFYGTKMKPDPITKQPVWFYPESKRTLRFFGSAVVVLLMMSVVFISIAGVITLRMSMRVMFVCPNDDESCEHVTSEYPVLCIFVGTFLPTLLNAVSVLLLSYAYSGIAEKLTNWENHQTQSDYNDALVIKLFAFNFVNSYAILFYIAFFRPKSHNLQHNGLFGIGAAYKDVCASQKCMSLLSLQVLLLMIAKPIGKYFYDVIFPVVKIRIKPGLAKIREIIFPYKVKIFIDPEDNPQADGTKSNATGNLGSSSNDPMDSYIYREWKKPKLGEFTLEEFNEKIILFGYLVMFSVALPLAPLIALCFNLIDMRVDARRLLWLNRRPIPFIAADIGTWQSIIRFINFCAIITNAFLVGTATPLAEGQKWKYRLIIMLVFEHIVFVLEYMIDMVIPDVPASIRENQRRERKEVYKILAGGGHLDTNSKVRKVLSGHRRTKTCIHILDDEFTARRTSKAIAVTNASGVRDSATTTSDAAGASLAMTSGCHSNIGGLNEYGKQNLCQSISMPLKQTAKVGAGARRLSPQLEDTRHASSITARDAVVIDCSQLGCNSDAGTGPRCPPY